MPWTLRDLMSEATCMAKIGGSDMIPSRVSGYVNQAFRDIADRLPAVEYERIAVSSTSSGDDKLYLPADCERVLNVSLTTGVSNSTGGDGWNLRHANLWEVDNQSWGTQAGVPAMFLSYATWIQLYPSPNSQYSLMMRYVGRYSEITDLNSIPSVDTRYHMAGLFKTVEYLYMRQANDVQANFYRSRYEAELRNQPSALEQRQHDRTGFSARLLLKQE